MRGLSFSLGIIYVDSRATGYTHQRREDINLQPNILIYFCIFLDLGLAGHASQLNRELRNVRCDRLKVNEHLENILYHLPEKKLAEIN